jgi:hypothetical protein
MVPTEGLTPGAPGDLLYRNRRTSPLSGENSRAGLGIFAEAMPSRLYVKGLEAVS